MTSTKFLRSIDLPTEVSNLAHQAKRIDLAVPYVTKVPKSLTKFATIASLSKRRMRVIVGTSNQFVTSPKGLASLVNLIYDKHGRRRRRRSGFQLEYFHDPRFHAKLLLFEKRNGVAAIIGSSNLTGGAHGEGKPNIEANVLLKDNISGDFGPVQQARRNFDIWWKKSQTIHMEGIHRLSCQISPPEVRFSGGRKRCPQVNRSHPRSPWQGEKV